MFEFGRELKKLFGAEIGVRTRHDGLTGGDQALLELLDLELLRGEGEAADQAASRIAARDRPQRQLESAIVWREVARRSGDPAALRKAAALAEAAARAFDRSRRPDGWARARCEQAFCAILGAELFGDEGLNAAAEIALREARRAARGGLAAPLADVGLSAVEARRLMGSGDAQDARRASARFDAPILALEALVRRCSAARILAAEARAMRADILAGWGARLKDPQLLGMAIADAEAALGGLDRTYEPLTHARLSIIRGQALALSGEALGDLDAISDGVSITAAVLDDLSRDHSPLDWARGHVALAQAVQALGEASLSERAYEQAITCYERADLVLRATPSLTLRAVAATNRAACLARCAEFSADLGVLDAAEAAFKMELSSQHSRRDPVSWALVQVNLARIYEARIELTGQDRGERSKAALALSAALDVFAEEGLRSFSLLALEGLERLKVRQLRPG